MVNFKTKDQKFLRTLQSSLQFHLCPRSVVSQSVSMSLFKGESERVQPSHTNHFMSCYKKNYMFQNQDNIYYVNNIYCVDNIYYVSFAIDNMYYVNFRIQE